MTRALCRRVPRLGNRNKESHALAAPHGILSTAFTGGLRGAVWLLRPERVVGDRLGGRAGSIFLLLSGGQETGHKHDENSDQPQHLGGNAGDHEPRTSNNIDSVNVNNEQKNANY